MNGWNSQEVHSLYASQATGVITKREDGRINVERPAVATILRKKIADGADPDSNETIEEAIQEANSLPQGRQMPYTKPLFGCVAGWLSEVAPENLNGLLKHADTYLKPSWSKGGLYYPRNDTKEDSQGNWLCMDPATGNGAIGFSRLNVPDGQKLMWENAWTPEKVQSTPAVENVSFSDDVDFLRCQWVTESEYGFTGLVMTLRTWDGESRIIHPRVVALPPGDYQVFVDGSLAKTHQQGSGRDFEFAIDVNGEERTVCILKTA